MLLAVLPSFGQTAVQRFQRLQSDLDGMQGAIGKKERQLLALLVKLSEAKRRLKTAEIEEKRVSSEIEKILQRIKEKTQAAIKNVHLGMTEVDMSQNRMFDLLQEVLP